MRPPPPTSIVVPGHPDFGLCTQLESKILARCGGLKALRSNFPDLIRRANDEVIDTPRTGRRSLSETEKTEKTYLGTKIEILIRDYLVLPKGKLDLNIDGLDVDVKNTTASNWMIPDENINKPCLLIASDEQSFLCYFGIIVAKLEYLTAGQNRDSKRSISASGKENIYWILNGESYPRNFWSDIEKDIAFKITDSSIGGTQRLYLLFKHITRKPISRYTIEGVARQKDFMKRLRRNGGARDKLSREGIALLSGTSHISTIAKLDLPDCARDEFISIRPENSEEERILRNDGHID